MRPDAVTAYKPSGTTLMPGGCSLATRIVDVIIFFKIGGKVVAPIHSCACAARDATDGLGLRVGRGSHRFFTWPAVPTPCSPPSTRSSGAAQPSAFGPPPGLAASSGATTTCASHPGSSRVMGCCERLLPCTGLRVRGERRRWRRPSQ
jgi:hypothetical protein